MSTAGSVHSESRGGEGQSTPERRESAAAPSGSSTDPGGAAYAPSREVAGSDQTLFYHIDELQDIPIPDLMDFNYWQVWRRFWYEAY